MPAPETNALIAAEWEIERYFSFQPELERFELADYVPAVEYRRWPLLMDSYETTAPPGQTYEERLFGVLGGAEVKSQILLVIGGIGCGKTSTMHYLMKKRGDCRHGCPRKPACAHPPVDVYINLLNTPGARDAAPDEDLWGVAASHLRNEVSALVAKSDVGQLDGGPGLVSFWRWLSENAPKFRASFMLTYVDAYGKAIREGAQATLEQAYVQLMREFNPHDRCTYRIAELAFLLSRREGSCPANMVVLDNIDQRDPAEHVDILALAGMIASVFPSRVLIPMRPFTYFANRGYCTHLTAYMLHAVPGAYNVLASRVRRFADKGGAYSTHMALADLLRRIDQDEAKFLPFKELLRATCGDSSRFLLRNIHNMLVSPSLKIAPDDATPFDFQKMTASQLYEAYFCGADRRLRLSQFENLFNVGGAAEPERRVVKFSILSLLYNSAGRSMTLSELALYVEGVLGLPRALLVAALNELCSKARPLLWSTHTLRFDGQMLDGASASDHTLVLTQIGVGYYVSLCDSVYYVRECVYASNPAWNVAEKDRLGRWTGAAVRDLEDVSRIADSMMKRVEQRFGASARRAVEPERQNFAGYFVRMTDRLREWGQRRGA